MAIWAVLKYVSSPWIIIVCSSVTFVYAEMTLRLRDNAVVYGQPFALVCYTTVDASTQYAVVYRSLSPDAFVTSVATISYKGPGSCQATPSSFSNYTYSCDNNGKDITLTVPADNLNEHNTYWKCINPGGTVLALNNMVSIYVNVPVSFVQISQAGNVTLNESDYRTLSCKTSFCRPAAEISWWKNDVNITSMANSSTYDQNSTTGILGYTGNRLDDGHAIVCKAWNGYGYQQTSQQIFLDIRYAPAGPPTVGNFSNGSVFSVIENSIYTVACIVTGGNPLAYLSWNCFGLPESSTIVNHTVTSAISLSVNRTRDRQQCQCVSTQEVQGEKTVYVLIHVLYSPAVISFISPIKLTEGSLLDVLCKADGNPAPQLTWIPQGEDTVNPSRLYYRNISRSSHGNYTCSAINTMEPSTGSPVTQSDSKGLVIDVLYISSISAFTTQDNNNVIKENGNIQLHCQVDSNPLSDIFLYHEDKLKLTKENTLNLNYTKTVGCLDAGKYTCCANNSMINGNSVCSVLQIMVACSPRLDHRKNVSTVYYRELNSNVTLEVYVIAYPEPTNITWYHKESETDTWQRVTYQPPSSGGLFSSVLIHLISARDFGYYMVTMDNYLGNFSHTYSIIPESIPDVPKDFSVTDSGLETVTLEWVPGFAGGHLQHFIIEYAKHSVGEWLKSDEILDVGSPVQSFILSGLQQKTTYQLLMYAENMIGRSEKTQTIKATTLDRDKADVFPVGAVAGGISGAVITVTVVILVLICWRRVGLRNKDKDDDFTEELQASGKSIKDHPYTNTGTSYVPTGGEYEVLQDHRNESSFYQELSDKKRCAETNYSLRRNATDTSKKCPTYVNTKNTTAGSQDHGNLPKGENKIYENTRVQA